MIRTLFVLVALLVLVSILHRALPDAHDVSQLEPAYVRFIDTVRGSEQTIGAIRLMDAAGTDLVYTNRFDGIWRCIPAHGAMVDLRRMERLFDRLLTAPAFVRSHAPRDPTVFGLGLDDTVVVSMHAVGSEEQAWEDEPPILELEIGLPLPDEEQVFVRVVGERTVYVLESDPWPDLLPAARGLPPLVDGRLMPAVWPGSGAPPRRALIVTGEDDRILLSRESDDRWTVTESGGGTRPGLSLPIMTYLSLLQRAPVIGLPDPARAEHMGLNDPSFRVVLEFDDLPVVELRFGIIQSWGQPVHNSFVRGIVAIDPELADVLLPSDPAPFVEEGHPNPWFRLLERLPQAEPPWRWGAVRRR